MPLSAEKERSLGNGRRGHADFAHRVLGKQFQFPPCFYDMDLALLAREIDLSIPGDRGSGEPGPAIGEAQLINAISGSGFITTEYAVVSAGVEIVSVDERRLHVSPFPRLTPGYMLVRLLFAFERNVTGCAQADRVDGSHAPVSVCDEDQAMGDDWSWNRDVTTAGKFPDFLSGRGIIA